MKHELVQKADLDFSVDSLKDMISLFAFNLHESRYNDVDTLKDFSLLTSLIEKGAKHLKAQESDDSIKNLEIDKLLLAYHELIRYTKVKEDCDELVYTPRKVRKKNVKSNKTDNL